MMEFKLQGGKKIQGKNLNEAFATLSATDQAELQTKINRTKEASIDALAPGQIVEIKQRTDTWQLTILEIKDGNISYTYPGNPTGEKMLLSEFKTFLLSDPQTTFLGVKEPAPVKPEPQTLEQKKALYEQIVGEAEKEKLKIKQTADKEIADLQAEYQRLLGEDRIVADLQANDKYKQYPIMIATRLENVGITNHPFYIETINTLLKEEFERWKHQVDLYREKGIALHTFLPSSRHLEKAVDTRMAKLGDNIDPALKAQIEAYKKELADMSNSAESSPVSKPEASKVAAPENITKVSAPLNPATPEPQTVVKNASEVVVVKPAKQSAEPEPVNQPAPAVIASPTNSENIPEEKKDRSKVPMLESDIKRYTDKLSRLEYSIPNTGTKIRLNPDGSYKDGGMYKGSEQKWQSSSVYGEQAVKSLLAHDYLLAKKQFDEDTENLNLLTSPFMDKIIALIAKLGGTQQLEEVLSKYTWEERGTVASVSRDLPSWILNCKDKLPSIEKIIDAELVK